MENWYVHKGIHLHASVRSPEGLGLKRSEGREEGGGVVDIDYAAVQLTQNRQWGECVGGV